MNREDIAHLATLARISLTEQELQAFEGELSSIVSYVGVISDIASDDSVQPPQVGPVHNVFRDDVVTNPAGMYTAALLAEMPHTQGQYLKVKKILSIDE